MTRIYSSFRIIICLAFVSLTLSACACGILSFKQTVIAGKKKFAITGLKIDLKTPGISVKCGLAWQAVGRTESLGGIASDYGAVAAINGSFFDAYSNEKMKNPDMSLITDGHLIFKSDIGSMLGFSADNTPHLGPVRYKLTGTVTDASGHTLDWYAYWINRKPIANPCVTIFTRLWGATVDDYGGTAVVVENGVVTAITTGKVDIPQQGVVIHIIGEEKLLAKFHVGDKVAFTPQAWMDDNTDLTSWSDVMEAVSAGPCVLKNGRPMFNPKVEGFSDPKVLTKSGARSAVGFTKDKVLYLIVTNGTVADMGMILMALGCTDGMNLDGGASSGLWYKGSYLRTPGRQISNALLVMEKKTETEKPGTTPKPAPSAAPKGGTTRLGTSG